MNRRLDTRKNAPITECHVLPQGQAPVFPQGWGRRWRYPRNQQQHPVASLFRPVAGIMGDAAANKDHHRRDRAPSDHCRRSCYIFRLHRSRTSSAFQCRAGKLRPPPDAQPDPPPLRQSAPDNLARLLRRRPCRHDRRSPTVYSLPSILANFGISVSHEKSSLGLPST
jgi:hypothetical protein